jgi:hypothetical protein
MVTGYTAAAFCAMLAAADSDTARPEDALMTDAPAKLKRLLHMKIRAVGDPKQALALMQGGSQFYRALGGARFRYLQNVDDPAQFLVEVEYEADAAVELNRQKVASDPMVRTFLTGWRQMLAGTADMDVYEDVTG